LSLQITHHHRSGLAIQAIDRVSVQVRAAPFPIEEAVAFDVETFLSATKAHYDRQGSDVVVSIWFGAPRPAFTG
jgi:hypothetical protein